MKIQGGFGFREAFNFDNLKKRFQGAPPQDSPAIIKARPQQISTPESQANNATRQTLVAKPTAATPPIAKIAPLSTEATLPTTPTNNDGLQAAGVVTINDPGPAQSDGLKPAGVVTINDPGPVQTDNVQHLPQLPDTGKIEAAGTVTLNTAEVTASSSTAQKYSSIESLTVNSVKGTIA